MDKALFGYFPVEKKIGLHLFYKNIKSDLHDEYIKHLNQFKKEYEIRKN